MITIAIIEDEEDLLELLEFTLQQNGYDAVGFTNTKKVKDFIIEENPDLLIVDRNLPGVEGSLFVKKLKEEGYEIPVIFLTAKADEDDIVEGFERGADDYITKPFNMKELLARIKAVLKRYSISTSVISYKDYHLDLNGRTLTHENIDIPLTPSEFRLLELFFKNPKRTLSRPEIMEELGSTNEKSVNVAINRLNHKVGNIIESVRGVGYKLK
ncbi:response regulator transcription factor [Nautilia sp.]